MSSLGHLPQKSARMRHRKGLQVDVEQSNAVPPRRKRPINGRTHTTYKDLVSVLRGKGEATEALAHYQETGKSLGCGLGVVVKKSKQKLAEPHTPKRVADPNDYSNMFKQDLSGEFGDMEMKSYDSEQNVSAHQVHASNDVIKPPGQALSMVDTLQNPAHGKIMSESAEPGTGDFGTSIFVAHESTPFIKSIIKRYPYPNDVVKERTDDDYKALFDDLPSPKK